MISGNLFHEFDVRELGAYLKEVRESKGLSIRKAAKCCNVSSSWIAKLESHKNINGYLSSNKLKRYCLGLGLDIQLEYNFKIEEEEGD